MDGKQRNGTLLKSDEIAPKPERLKNNIHENMAVQGNFE